MDKCEKIKKMLSFRMSDLISFFVYKSPIKCKLVKKDWREIMNRKYIVGKKTLRKIITVLLGTILYAAGIGLFLDPNDLAPGGVVGISVIFSHVFGGETGSWYFLFNIPIILIGWWKFGGKFIIWSFYAIACNSLFTNLFGTFIPITKEPLLAALAGSLLVGSGIGIVLRSGSTTGGMDIIVKILRKKHPSIKTSSFFMLLDIIVVSTAGVIFNDFNVAMYAFIAVVMSGKVMEYVLYGADEATLVFIISDHSKVLLERILQEMEVGATILTGRGAYSKNEKNIIMCVVKKRYTASLEELVKQEDSHSFMIVTSANEIYGEGYKDISLERL